MKIVTKKNFKIAGLLTSLMLSACNSGSSNNSINENNTVGNFTRLTPDQGVPAPQPQNSVIKYSAAANSLPPFDYFTTMTLSNQGNLYAGTAYGYVYQITNINAGFNSFSGKTIINPNPVGNSIIAFGANQNLYAYTTQNESTVIQGTAKVNIQAKNAITAISLAANSLTYYGTLNGQIFVVDDNKQIAPFIPVVNCIDPNFCPISAIGLTSNNAASGKKGVAALQLSAESLPVFDANQAKDDNWALNFSSAVACLEQDGTSGYWVKDLGVGIPSQLPESYSYTYEDKNGNTVESTITTNVPQFITTMLASTNGVIYVGTNLFNVYAAFACNMPWTKINTVPLATVQNGSLGITNIGLINNQLFVITNNTESIISAYRYNSKI